MSRAVSCDEPVHANRGLIDSLIVPFVNEISVLDDLNKTGGLRVLVSQEALNLSHVLSALIFDVYTVMRVLVLRHVVRNVQLGPPGLEVLDRHWLLLLPSFLDGKGRLLGVVAEHVVKLIGDRKTEEGGIQVSQILVRIFASVNLFPEPVEGEINLGDFFFALGHSIQRNGDGGVENLIVQVGSIVCVQSPTSKPFKLTLGVVRSLLHLVIGDLADYSCLHSSLDVARSIVSDLVSRAISGGPLSVLDL